MIDRDLIVDEELVSSFQLCGRGWLVTEQESSDVEVDLLNLNQVAFRHCLEGSENRITGDEKLKRLTILGVPRLGVKFGLSLLRQKGQRALNIFGDQKLFWFDLPGSVLCSLHHHRCLLYLHHDGIRWLGGRADSRVIVWQLNLRPFYLFREYFTFSWPRFT